MGSLFSLLYLQHKNSFVGNIYLLCLQADIRFDNEKNITKHKSNFSQQVLIITITKKYNVEYSSQAVKNQIIRFISNTLYFTLIS